MTKSYIRLDKHNAAVLVDHQTGLLSLVHDIDPDKFKKMYWHWQMQPNTLTCRPF